MKRLVRISIGAALALLILKRGVCQEPSEAALTPPVKAVWDLGAAYRETTPTRERICINGLWRWQPARDDAGEVPAGGWGFFKVPGCWPGTTDYLQKDCQTVYPHAVWKEEKLGAVKTAWYQRRIAIPEGWAGRRIALQAECVNSYAAVFVDGRKAGEMRFPGGEVDLTTACRPGGTHLLSLLVIAMPLKAVMLSFSDTAAAKEARGTVERRGLCGDVYLSGTPAGPRIREVRVDTSVRKGEIAFKAALEGLAPGGRHTLHARIADDGGTVAEFTGEPFTTDDLKDGRTAFTARWKPEKLWDLPTAMNQYQLTLSLLEGDGRLADAAFPERFGFREFWIEGRDFYLNGSRVFLSALPLDNAAVSAAAATYEGVKESLLRLQSFGINFVYTHNYGCEPGVHLSFAEALRAADDVGMLVAFSQPHFGQYDWKASDAERTNGYASHAESYVRTAGSHPSVVMYSMSHNATGYGEDMDPDQIDGIAEPRQSWGRNNARLALRAEAIVKGMDPSRIVYHHSSGNLGSMHTVNFYTNFAPAQELDDWFEHWSTKGVKPMFTCEYMVPCTWDWTMYRGWYKGKREFGSATVPWEFCQAEWSAQVLGERAYRIGEPEKANLRWEAKQFRQGKLWHCWDYPHPVGAKEFEDQHTVIGKYLEQNWRAFRTWGLSANSPWEHHFFWSLRPGVDRRRVDLPVDWERLQRPGFSPDFLDDRFERMDLAYGREDWIPTADGKALLRNNLPLLAYIAGKPGAFTSKDHLFLPGETVEKQLIVINNARRPVTCDFRWSFPPTSIGGGGRVTVATGQQQMIPLHIELPAGLSPGKYEIDSGFEFGGGEKQDDSLTIHVLPAAPRSAAPGTVGKIALFDPRGETRDLLTRLQVPCEVVAADADLASYAVLVVGKAALGVDGAGPDLSRVRDGLKVIVFEQTAEVLEKRLGFRIAEYGLRQAFPRVPDHPVLHGLDVEHLRDWRGAATLSPPRLKYELSPRLAYTPAVVWCGLEVSRVWRCGNRGNVASVLIEKPARGDFLPVLDGGYGLQYSPLLEYREGKGMVLFCQADVTGRSEGDPAAETLVRNVLRYTMDWRPAPRREAIYYGDAAGKRHLERAGVAAGSPAGGRFSADQVLVVGPGGGRELAPSAAAVATFLKAGGRLLALGLDEGEANGFLPFQVGTRKEEHISAFFEPPGAGSPLVGVCTADVHDRDPREMPLVKRGATVIGDGVLATAGEGNVVFCQLLPWEFGGADGGAPPAGGKQLNRRKTYRRASFLLTRLLGNVGVESATPLLVRFRQPVKPGEKRWLEGLYLDQPEEWDDPYRFFRW